MSNRTTITLLPDLLPLVELHIPPGESLSHRLAALTRRYFTLVKHSLPALSHEHWKTAIETAQQLDTRHPLSHNALLGLLRGSKTDHKLAYSAENLTVANLYAIIHVSETIAATLGPGPYDLDRLAPHLPPPRAG